MTDRLTRAAAYLLSALENSIHACARTRQMLAMAISRYLDLVRAQA